MSNVLISGIKIHKPYTGMYPLYLYHKHNTDTLLGIRALRHPSAATSGNHGQDPSFKETVKPWIRPACLPTQTPTAPPTPYRTILPLT